MSRPLSGRVGFVSLGCPKALVDSERILTQLKLEGYQTVPTFEGADVVVINTCGFIDAAIEESLETIEEAVNANGKVVVTGCLGARAEFIRERFPALLAVTGPAAYESVLDAVHQVVPPRPFDPKQDLLGASGGVKLTPRHYAYLKISEGCNHHCSFCIIPSMRGRLASRRIGDVLDEAEALVRAGVKELLVISQDTSAYGVDLKYRTDFWQGRPLKNDVYTLAARLGEIAPWVRMHYVYPYPHVDRLLPLMADGKVLPYLDVPLQHGAPRILSLMRRPAAAERTLDRIRGWREMCPDITLRSTFIVGFPGETESEFQSLLEFLTEAELDRVGCFAYSDVDGAAANALPDPVPETVKVERLERFMEHQAGISAARLARRIGETIDAIVDRVDSDGTVVARSRGDAPEVDGLVFATPSTVLATPNAGDFVRVCVEEADTHDLFGTLVSD